MNEPRTGTSLPSDLKAAHDEVVGLAEYLLAALAPPLNELSQHPDRTVPSLLAALGSAVQGLDTRIKSCEHVVNPVRPDLDAVAGRRESAHARVLSLAGQVDQGVRALFQAGEVDGNQLQRQLAHWHVQLVSVYQTRSGPTEYKSGLGYELEEASRARLRNSPTRGRVLLLDADRAVVIDGRRVATGLTPDQFRFIKALESNYPDALTFKQIGAKYGVKEKNSTRMRNSFRADLAKYVTSSTKGFALILPSETNA